MALVSFARGTQANILALGTNKTAVEGKIYYATDTSQLYIGNSDGTISLIHDRENTEYGLATTTLAGLMSADEHNKLAAITDSADAVSVTQTLKSGTEVGKVTVNGTATTLYAPTDTNTTYSISNSGSTITLTPSSGTAQSVTVPNTNTTYTLTQDTTDGHKLTFTPSSGTATTITIPDNNTVALGSMTGTLGVAHGGTGATTLASNAIVTGNGTGAVKTVATASGAFYADSTNGAAKFGTLPVAQGGTGSTTASGARTNLGVYSTSEVDTKISTAVTAVYKYKGSVKVADLPTSGRTTGDVYNITDDSTYGKAGMNVAWNGSAWDALGSNVDLSNYVKTDDSRLTNSRPASDVYSWAKASTKPSYSASEISGLGNLATKSTNSSTSQFLRGDGTWATPAYPTVNNSTITIKQTGKTDQTFTLNGNAATISLSDNNTWNALKGATASADGTAGYVAAPTRGQQGYVLYGSGSWGALPTSLPANGGTATNVSGTVAIANGGTGATTAAAARTNLGLGSLATKSSLSYSDVGADQSGAASSALSSAKSYADGLLEWGTVS